MFAATHRVDGSVMWANLHLLFWLSLVPFATAWMGRTISRRADRLYGVVLLMAAIAYYILSRRSSASRGPRLNRRGVGNDVREVCVFFISPRFRWRS